MADRSVPECTSDTVLESIRAKALAADAAVLKRGTSLVSIERIRQTFAGPYTPSSTYRRFCEASARMSDGKKTPLYYLLEQTSGFASLSWNVEYCMLGADPWRVHDGRCHTVRYRWW